MNEMSRRVRLAKEKQNRKRIKLMVVAALILVVLGIAGFAVIKARNLIVERLAKVVPVQEGVLEQTKAATGLLLHQADILRSPASGEADFLVPEGERVRVGTVIARVNTNKGTAAVERLSFDVKAPRSGVVCYHPDGLEGLISDDILDKLGPEQIKELNPTPYDVRREVKIAAGEPLARIVDNLGQTLIYTEVPLDLFDEPLQQGKSLGVEVGAGPDNYYKAKIVALRGTGEKAQIVLALPVFRQDFIDMRRVDMKLVIQRFSGVVAPVEAIVEKDGKDGVYAVRKGVVHWQEVKIEGRMDEKVIVDGILPGTRIVVNPKLAAEGDLVE